MLVKIQILIDLLESDYQRVESKFNHAKKMNFRSQLPGLVGEMKGIRSSIFSLLCVEQGTITFREIPGGRDASPVSENETR